MAIGDEKFLENGEIPNGEPDEDEEEEDLVDPHDSLKEKCAGTAACQKFAAELEACNERVSSKSATTETCHQEIIDFFHCQDHCVAKSLFSQLK